MTATTTLVFKKIFSSLGGRIGFSIGALVISPFEIYLAFAISNYLEQKYSFRALSWLLTPGLSVIFIGTTATAGGLFGSWVDRHDRR